MSFNSENKDNYFKIAHILHLVRCNDNPRIIVSKMQEVFKSGIDINFKLKLNDLLFDKEQQFVGYTLLHLFAEWFPFKITKYLDFFINKGVDFLIQNDDGYSPLLLAFVRGVVVNSLLLAQFNANNATNLRSRNGLSHFHVSCSTNNIKLIDFFIKNGAPIDQRVNDDSLIYPGYTPLHFAIKYNNHQAIEFLLNHGASLHIQNTNRVTPLNLLITNLIENKPSNKGSLMDIVYPKIFSFSNDLDLTSLHIYCIFNKLTMEFNLLEQNIDAYVKFDLPVFPGYTALHFASHFNLKIVTILLEKGADVFAKNANNVTPFDICLKKFNLNGVITIISSEKRYNLFELKLTDGTLLISVLRAMKTSTQLTKFTQNELKNVNAYIPDNSFLWPGYTLLHLAVMFNHSFALTLMSRKADITMLNTDGLSPLHLAFYMKKDRYVKSILNFHEKISVNAVDRNNLSHLHIACSGGNSKVVNLLLRKDSRVNLSILANIENQSVRKGSTPLHVALLRYETDCSIEKRLLNAGANPNAADENGETPFEITLNRSFLPTDENKKIQVLIEIMLKTDASVRITNRVANYILLNSSLIKKQPTLFKRLISELIEIKIYEKLGLTKLEVACAIGDFSMLDTELKAGADLNRRIDHKSPLWPGDTALHILFRENKIFTYNIQPLLYKYGANPTIKNANNLTAVFLSSDQELTTAISLLKDKFTDINPANEEGLTHFHMSCKANNMLVVEQFLKNGVNVNTPVSYFASHYPGYTPLHFSMRFFLSNLDKLLICYGANPHTEATDGLTLKKGLINFNSKTELNNLLSHIKSEKQILNIELKNQIDSIFSVNYFLSEQFIVDYKRMTVSRRQAILNFCSSNNFHSRFPKLYSLITLQCYKAKRRTQLIELATNALRILVDIAVPDLCCECIFENLSNIDLNSLIRAKSGKL